MHTGMVINFLGEDDGRSCINSGISRYLFSDKWRIVFSVRNFHQLAKTDIVLFSNTLFQIHVLHYRLG